MELSRENGGNKNGKANTMGFNSMVGKCCSRGVCNRARPKQQRFK